MKLFHVNRNVTFFVRYLIYNCLFNVHCILNNYNYYEIRNKLLKIIIILIIFYVYIFKAIIFVSKNKNLI